MNPDIDPTHFLIEIARTNFAAFVSAVHRPRFTHSAFSAKVCRAVDQFVLDVLDDKRPILMLTAPPQTGKQFADDTPIFTQNRGWQTHGVLRVGDSVYRPDGTTTDVVAVSAPQSCDMRVEISDGTVLTTHSRHEWVLHKTWVNSRPKALFETQDIAARGCWKGLPGQRGSRANFQLPHVQPLQNGDAALPIDPYVLGIWMGDGRYCDGTVTLAGRDTCVAESIAALGYEASRRHRCNAEDWQWHFPRLTQELRDAGLAAKSPYQRYIPDIYFQASLAQRLELLAGLIDSDGCVYAPNGRVTFANTDPGIVLGAERLIASFGWRVTTQWTAPTLSSSGIQGYRDVAAVSFQPDRAVPCRIVRYREGIKPDAMVRKRAIVRTESGEFGLGRCIQVAHPDGMYLVGNTFVPTHNSSLISRCLGPYLMGRLAGFLPSVRIANATYALPLARRNATDIKSIMSEPIYREIFPHASLIGFRGNQNTSNEFDTPCGQVRAVGVGGPLTGFSVDIATIDDAVKNSDEALSQVVQDGLENWYDSVLLTRMQQRSGIVFIGTPWSANDLLARVRKKVEHSENFTRLSFPALNYPDEVGYDESLPLGSLVPALHSEEKLRETKRYMSEMWWASMYQQTPLADFGAIFPRANLQLYKRADAPPQFMQVCMSVDATFKDGDASDYVAVGVWGKTQDERVWLLDFRRERLAFMATARAILDLKKKWPTVRRVYIEEAANGAALIDMLKKHIVGLVGVKPLGSKEARAHAVSWVWSNNQVMLPDPTESPGIAQWIAEITAFPDVKNDDTVDCMTIALQQLCLRNPISSMITQQVLRAAGV